MREDIHKDEIIEIIEKHCEILKRDGDGFRIKTKQNVLLKDYEWDLWIEEDEEMYSIVIENEKVIAGPSLAGLLGGGRKLMEKIDLDIGIMISERRIAFKNDMGKKWAELMPKEGGE